MNNIVENNKLIAEFMGLQLEQEQDRIFIKGLGTKLIEETFNTDWNWLMEVVESIEKLNFRFEIWKVEDANLHRVDILKMGWENESVFDHADGWSKLTYSSKKEAVYSACVEFIKWYNQNK